jgi:hypothetical protein
MLEGYRMTSYKSNKDINELRITDVFIILRNYQGKWLE